jgi:zinc and cadmium transporter
MDPTLLWIVASGLLMSAIALVGSVTLVLPESTLRLLILPLVALAAGSLLGGALFHMIPATVDAVGNQLSVYAWIATGFATFFVLEQFLQWHHCHLTPSEHGEHKTPLGYLVLVADGLHNFIGGLAVAGSFLIDIRLGVTTWIAAAAHEVPQELGDFGVLVHSGWRTKTALLYNVASALTFLLGGLVAYVLSRGIDVTFLVPFAAGNFIYIASADLIPEVNKEESLRLGLLHFCAFTAGLLLLFAVKAAS